MDDALIYLDHHATTPCDPEVIAAMAPLWRERFGNPASATHAAGRAAAAAVAQARAEVAALIGASPAEIVFTSGATEALHLALHGLVLARGERPSHIVATAIEHAAVLDTCAALAAHGVGVTLVGVGPDGLVDPAAVIAALRPDTVAVAVMAANNEVGTVQPLAAIAAGCRAAGVPLVVDAAQAAGRIPCDAAQLGADLMAVSAHKIYGPKGVGALYVRRRPAPPLAPSRFGGGQERGLRPGTLNVPGVVGFGVAARLALVRLEADALAARALRDRLLAGLRAAVPDLHVHGDLVRRLPNNLSVAFPGVEARALLEAVPAVAASSGSACASAEPRASHVLRALGADPSLHFSTVRFGLGRETTAAEVDRAVALFAAAAARLRRY